MKRNELYHWKYIKREKVNGKWVYTYDKPDFSKKKAEYTTYSNENGKQVKTTYRESDKLTSSTQTMKVGDKTHVIETRGVVDRYIEKGEAYVAYLKGVSKHELDISDSVIGKAKKAVGYDDYNAMRNSKSQVDQSIEACAQTMIAYANNKAALQDVEKTKKVTSESIDSYNEYAKTYNQTLLGKLSPAELYVSRSSQVESEARRLYMTNKEWHDYKYRLMRNR